MAKIFIDDKPYEVDGSKNLLEVCLSLGLNLTYFCWHPALHSVGACRQCGVLSYRDENDKKGKLVMACMQPATDNTRISIEAPDARAFRAGNIEALMINHPHDCPVCDEGGECHLQDMTLMSGHNYRRYRFNKRTHYNQYLGPFINHEMNRCIQCYRCVRYYKDYAGGKDLNVFAAHDHIYFGRHEDGVLESEFSGNLVEVCPTGVFTDKTLRQHYTRKWDFTMAPSVCHQCSLGCNIIAGERYGTIRRIVSRFNGDVNGYFLCDRGRFGYEYVNSEKRIRFPLKKQDDTTGTLTRDAALQEIAPLIASGKKVIGIGSPRASLESNFVLRSLVGEANFYAGIPKAEGALVRQALGILQNGKVRTPSLNEAGDYDAVFILGEDVTNTAPMLALSLRQAARNQPLAVTAAMKIPAWNDAATREVIQDSTGPFFLAAVCDTRLDDIATGTFHGHPDDIARLGLAVMARMKDRSHTMEDMDEAANVLAGTIADALLTAKKPLIVSGTSLYSEAVIRAAADIAYALKDLGKDAGLIYALPAANSMGLAMLTNQYLEDAFERAGRETTDTALILENDLYREINGHQTDDFFRHVGNAVALDYMENATTQRCSYVLPAGTFAESDGTIVNNEGRAQRFYQVFVPDNDTRSSWEWLDAITAADPAASRKNLDAVIDGMVQAFPALQPVKELAPPADFRKGTQKIPREPHRYSGRTAMRANISVHEPRPPADPDSPLTFTMEGFQGVPPSADIPFFWSPGWNSIQAINKYQIEVGGPLHGGNPGKRLLEPSADSQAAYSGEAPAPFTPRVDEWQVVPLYHIFGSDELSAESPAIAERTPAPYLAMNGKDAAKAGIAAGGKIELVFNEQKLRLPVIIKEGLPEGTAGLPWGLKETRGIVFPFRATINTVSHE